MSQNRAAPMCLAAARLSSQLLVNLENMPKDEKRIKFSLRSNDDNKGLTKKLSLLAKRAAAD